MASVGVKWGVKLPILVCHDRSLYVNFSVGVAWHQWACLGLSECGMASMIAYWVLHCITGSGTSSLGVAYGGMATVGVINRLRVCLLIRMCGMFSMGVACLQCVWYVLSGCGLSSIWVP